MHRLLFPIQFYTQSRYFYLRAMQDTIFNKSLTRFSDGTPVECQEISHPALLEAKQHMACVLSTHNAKG